MRRHFRTRGKNVIVPVGTNLLEASQKADIYCHLYKQNRIHGNTLVLHLNKLFWIDMIF